MSVLTIADYVEVGRKVNKARFYNGFTPAERGYSNAPQREARRNPEMNPLVCSISGYSVPYDPKGKGYMFTHLEDYSRDEVINSWLPCSKLAHRLLHARFTDPRAWFDFVARNYVHGAWWTMLVMSPFKMRPAYDANGVRRPPYWSIYPNGLPRVGEFWEDYATKAGISRELFQTADTRVPIRHFWQFPRVEMPAPPKVYAPAPPARRRVQPVAHVDTC